MAKLGCLLIGSFIVGGIALGTKIQLSYLATATKGYPYSHLDFVFEVEVWLAAMLTGVLISKNGRMNTYTWGIISSLLLLLGSIIIGFIEIRNSKLIMFAIIFIGLSFGSLLIMGLCAILEDQPFYRVGTFSGFFTFAITVGGYYFAYLVFGLLHDRNMKGGLCQGTSCFAISY